MSKSDRLANTVADTCRRLAVGRTTFHALVRAGELNVIKIGRKTLVSESELIRFIGSRAGELTTIEAGGEA